MSKYIALHIDLFALRAENIINSSSEFMFICLLAG